MGRFISDIASGIIYDEDPVAEYSNDCSYSLVASYLRCTTETGLT